jgi:hypothetical protein
MERGQADVLVSDLATAMGIADLKLGDDGMCLLSFDESRIIVSIGFNARTGSLDLMSCLDEVTPSPAGVAAALQANFDSGASGLVVAAEPSTGAIVVQRRYFSPDLGDGGLPAVVSAFVDDAEAWARRLGEPAAEAAAPERAAMPSFPMGIRG